MDIRNVKILDDVVEIFGVNSQGRITFESRSEPHKDFVNTVRVLNRHLVVINEQVETADPNKLKEADLEPYRVNGFQLFGSGDSLSIMLKGQKRLGNNKVFSMNTPKIYTENEDYAFSHTLYIEIMAAVEEANKYMEGKLEELPIEKVIGEN